MKSFRGTAVCPGISVGPVFLFQKTEIEIPDGPVGDPAAEWQRVGAAARGADDRLRRLYQKALETLGEQEAEIFEMHRLMLADLDFLDAIEAKILRENSNAMRAVSEAGAEFSVFFENLEDEYMRARAADVRDVAGLLLEILAGVPESASLRTPSIVVAEDLTPSETVTMDKSKILAFVTRMGSSNSHTAILARTMGVPSIVQADIPLDSAIVGKQMAVDGGSGVCYLQPDESTLVLLAQKQRVQQEYKAECEAVRGLPSISRNGTKLSVFANIGSGEDIAAVLENDAEGIGLFRSEFLYLGRKKPPGEEAQFAAYKNVAEKMDGKKVVIRTLDIGADKQVDYLGLEKEENPALGYRAVRICLDKPELFQTQLRAICRAAAFGNVAVMFPMIASVWEVQECKRALQAAKESLAAENILYGEVETGIMIETPAAVILRAELAKEVDFFSVGTNDLTQYTLAADRQNAHLDKYADPHHPAVLAMLQMVADSARKAGIWAGICGELAGDISLVDTFLSMGYTELSVAPPQVLPVRKAIRESLV